ncbi:cyclodeaminase/cyclohydrolase family protein [Megasphaera vaginalis (ex Bordigoni et al. 2020)]|uniref:cyclodeaminase/cyclohydrolase family protein n=1 Tax=Megasphaera vaginalis (ex Bordigoni et al. 2020) TaxID=2045301 RepID=UPI000C7BE34D|nr:cyclodeaminase/cyclohydrolase family protein [Megasphaera vaginalis (ex Bordigoni et al. 2020)]
MKTVLLQDCSDCKRPFGKAVIEEFLAATSSAEPVPGGGGIAALTAASAAALLEMVANLTVHKKGCEKVAPLLTATAAEAASLRRQYIAAIDADGEAFAAVLTALRINKAEISRSERVQAAFRHAAEVPLALGVSVYDLLSLAVQVVRYGNVWVITDGVIGAMNARAAMRSAFYSVRINLKSIDDEDFVRKTCQLMEETERKAALLEAEIERVYRERQ